VPAAHEQIGDFNFGRRREHPLARFDGGDKQVGGASFIGDVL
jgi:hypothetical protein